MLSYERPVIWHIAKWSGGFSRVPLSMIPVLSLDTTFDFDVEESGIFQCAECSLWRGIREITCPACRGRKRGHSRDFTCRLGMCQCPLADEPFQPVREAPELEVLHDEPVPLAAGVNPPENCTWSD